jgi:hypothetical protein
MYGNILSINITNNVGDALSPYLTPIFVVNVYYLLVFYSVSTPLVLIYIFLII